MGTATAGQLVGWPIAARPI